jgi:flagellar export protein FliJ
MAKKFKFRPEVILKLREQREQMARRNLAQAQSAVTEIQQRMQGLRGQLDDQTAMVRQGVLTGTVDVQYMSLYRRHMMALHRELIHQAQTLQQAAGQLQQARTEVVDASTQRKVMSKLKENLFDRYKAELERQERVELDEMTATRYGHRHLAELA